MIHMACASAQPEAAAGPAGLAGAEKGRGDEGGEDGGSRGRLLLPAAAAG